jgi:hypothetical protein
MLLLSYVSMCLCVYVSMCLCAMCYVLCPMSYALSGSAIVGLVGSSALLSDLAILTTSGMPGCLDSLLSGKILVL